MSTCRWRVFPLFSLFFASFLIENTVAEVKLIAPAGYLSGRPFPVRVEVRDAAGARDRELWNGEAVLSVDQPGVILSTNRVTLRNGLGTVLVSLSGNADCTLRASVDGALSARAVRNRDAEAVTMVSGTLSGASTTWSGVVNVTGNLTVPAGHVLSISPDTIVLVNGVTSGTSGIRITVDGRVRSLGTEAFPVMMTCMDPAMNWGQIIHEGTEPSLYQYTFISKAGRAPGEGHTGSGPALRARNTTLTLENCMITDLTDGGDSVGKIMMASDSALTFRDCVFARARMGPEIAGTGLRCEESYFMEMRGPDDADGIYLHESDGQELLLTGCVFAGGDDDGVDTLDSSVTLEDCILRDWANPNEDAKGISAFNGEVIARRCLFANCYVGIATKSSGDPGVVRIDHCTITGITRGVSAATKSNADAGNLEIYITNSIVRSVDALHSDFGADRFVSVTYCNLSENWPGAGNTAVDPLFVNADAGDFRLQPDSPCIDAGDPFFPLDADSSRTDVGFYTAEAAVGDRAVVISEIMYHPASENSSEEFIELFNPGPTPVNLAGWRFSDGVNFTFPNVALPARGYLVVAADLAAFREKYPGITNVLGDWTGALSNSREDIDLDDPQGVRVDSVRYADEGDWAARQAGEFDLGQRGWVWFAEHDGLGKSVELVNAAVSNNNGQNWASSLVMEGTPGRVNSTATNRTAPIIESVAHFPLVPKSTESVLISARLTGLPDTNPGATLSYRLANLTYPPFASTPMRDDGLGGDPAAGDGLYSALLPPQTNDSVVEFYITAADSSGLSRSWPTPAMAALDGAGATGQVANALYQVDDAEYTGTQPLYRIIMTELERAILEHIGDNVGGSANSDAQMNATFISIDGSGPAVHYLSAARNRGHGTRAARPNNFRVNFRSDQPWKGVLALNLNAQFSWVQVLGAALHTRSGSIGAYSRAVQLRVNNANLAFDGGLERTYGSYAANEVIDADWADRHFPNDSNGNIYRAMRDLPPAEFDYRTQEAYPLLFGAENKDSYTNTWFKAANASEDDWTDLIGMLRVIGTNGIVPFSPEEARRVINPEQWLRHLAMMNLLGNGETGLNSGINDDYFMYRGVEDPRFVLMYYDLDQTLGANRSFATNSSLFSAASNQGAGRALGRILRHPEFEPIYYETLRELIDTTFSAEEFDALVDQVLGDFVPFTVRGQLKHWMSQRREFVRAQLPAGPAPAPVAIVTGAPRSPTPRTSAAFRVSGDGVTHYRFSLNGGAFGPETTVQTPITLSALANGTNILSVIGRNDAGTYQSAETPATLSWVVNSAWPGVRLNEVIASRANQPDQIELYNEGAATVDLTGMRLTDDPAQPARFTFTGVTLAPGAFLVLDSGQLGFSFDAAGEGLYLFDAQGALLDSVVFGAQITGFSIGRIGESGAWQLTPPSFGAANIAQDLADAKRVKINEWLAASASSFAGAFIELHNPEALPIAIGGAYLTDQRAGAPTRSQIAPLSFIPAGGFLVFTSGNGNAPDEINFAPSSEQGEITLFAPDLAVIDAIIYGPQRAGVSSGRCPDGSPAQKPLQGPTPGASNDCPFDPGPPRLITLAPFDQAWKHDTSGVDLGTAWREIAYDDSGWPVGPGLLGFGDEEDLPEPILTPFENPDVTTYYFRTTFEVNPALVPSAVEVTHLVDDGAAFYLNGQEIGSRFNLAPNATSESFASRTIDDAEYETLSIAPSLLRPGTNLLAVEVHQANSSSSDMIFGLKLEALVVTNHAAEAGVLINELLAGNASLPEPDGSTPDWVEIYNPSADAVELTGMSLTDDSLNPARWVFPAGSVLDPRGFLRIMCEAERPASATNTGFGLKASGGSLYLFKSAADGGGAQSSVTYGLQAPDWSIGRVPDASTNWTLTIPSAGISNNAATLGNPLALKVNEWMADPATGEDWFEIFNPNAEPADLSGLLLSDDLTTRGKHILPALSFIGNAVHAFHKFEADELPGQGANHANFKLSADGESIALSASNGALIDGVSFGVQLTGVSQGRLSDGSTNVVSFTATASPGSANYLPLPNVVVNELLSGSGAPFMDAVEFYNSSAQPVDISGYFLSDSASDVRKYQIPPNSHVPPGGFLVIYEDRFNSDAASDPFSFNSTQGDEIYLSQTLNGQLTGYRASASFGAAENGVSFGRIPTSRGDHFVPLASLSFGRDNPATSNEFATGGGAPNSGPRISPVVFSEVMYHPPGTNDALEFIELHNRTVSAMPLHDPAHPAATWRLRRGIEFDFPPGTAIPARGYLAIVSFDPVANPGARAAFTAAYGSAISLLGPYQGRLNNSGDVIELQKPGSPEGSFVPYIVAEALEYDELAPWLASANGAGHSLQRMNPSLYGNDPVNWTASLPSPGGPPASMGDTDGDGLPNDWESEFGLNPSNPGDAVLDIDQDGLSNLEEYLAGTDPRNAIDTLRLDASFAEAGTALEFQAVPGRRYTLLYSDRSPLGPWHPLGPEQSVPAPSLLQITDPNRAAQARFYRVLVEN